MRPSVVTAIVISAIHPRFTSVQKMPTRYHMRAFKQYLEQSVTKHKKTKTCIKSKWQCWYGLLSLMLIWWILNIQILNSVHKFKCMYTTDSWLKEVAKSWRLWHGVLYYLLHFWYIFHILYSSIWIEPLIRNNFFVWIMYTIEQQLAKISVIASHVSEPFLRIISPRKATCVIQKIY